jgi:hypothetical protein
MASDPPKVLISYSRDSPDHAQRVLDLAMSAISQNQPGISEIKGLKTSHFKESKTAPLDRGEIGSMGHVECPQSEPANNDLQPCRSWMVATTNCERVGDQSRNSTPVSAAGKTGHFDRRL